MEETGQSDKYWKKQQVREKKDLDKPMIKWLQKYWIEREKHGQMQLHSQKIRKSGTE